MSTTKRAGSTKEFPEPKGAQIEEDRSSAQQEESDEEASTKITELTVNPGFKLPVVVSSDFDPSTIPAVMFEKNKCFNRFCPISKSNYRYIGLMHIRGVFRKHVKSCKTCNLTTQNYLRDINCKFPPVSMCQICCGVNKKKWVHFYSNGEIDIWVCKYCSQKQEAVLKSRLLLLQENVPKRLANNTIVFPPKRKPSLNRSLDDSMELDTSPSGGNSNNILFPNVLPRSGRSVHEEDDSSDHDLEQQQHLNYNQFHGERLKAKPRRTSSQPIRIMPPPPIPSLNITSPPTKRMKFVKRDEPTGSDFQNSALNNMKLMDEYLEYMIELNKHQRKLWEEKIMSNEPIKEANRKLLQEIKDLKLSQQKNDKRSKIIISMAHQVELDILSSKIKCPPSFRKLLDFINSNS